MVILGEKREQDLKEVKGKPCGCVWGVKVPDSKEALWGDMEGFVGFYSKCDGKLWAGHRDKGSYLQKITPDCRRPERIAGKIPEKPLAVSSLGVAQDGDSGGLGT